MDFQAGGMLNLTLPSACFYAPIMHLLLVDQSKLAYHFSGRNDRLTGRAGHVVQAVIA